jgi:hypothetical protein
VRDLVKRLGLRKTRLSAVALAVTVLVAGLVAVAATGVAATGLLHLAPALVLVVALLARRYPGERMIVRLAGSGAGHRRRARTLAVKPRVHVAARVPRGGLLLARSLAVRPPPAALSAG